MLQQHDVQCRGVKINLDTHPYTVAQAEPLAQQPAAPHAVGGARRCSVQERLRNAARPRVSRRRSEAEEQPGRAVAEVHEGVGGTGGGGR